MHKDSELLGKVTSRSDLGMIRLSHNAPVTALPGSTQGHTLSLQAVATETSSGGLTNLHQDVSMTSCRNANALPQTSLFNTANSTQRAESVLICSLNPSTLAPARELSNEMKADEFQAKNVTGHQGMQVQNSNGLIPQKKNANQL